MGLGRTTTPGGRKQQVPRGGRWKRFLQARKRPSKNGSSFVISEGSSLMTSRNARRPLSSPRMKLFIGLLYVCAELREGLRFLRCNSTAVAQKKPTRQKEISSRPLPPSGMMPNKFSMKFMHAPFNASARGALKQATILMTD